MKHTNIKCLISLTALFMALVCHAGLYKTTVHSRANCINNESITWWRGHPFNWRVVSVHKHRPTKEMHSIDTGFQHNDRVAAIHWGEGARGGFVVWGYHYLADYHKTLSLDTTYAKGCNIIDGWL